MQKKCEDCGSEIPAERLEILPDSRYCVKCAPKHDKFKHEPYFICAQSSPSGQNGFSPSS